MHSSNENKARQILAAKNEAERFMAKADKALQRLSDDEYAWAGNKEVAALKRSSMDLQAALVEVRKPY